LEIKCRNGEIVCGECKKILYEIILNIIKDFKSKKKKIKEEDINLLKEDLLPYIKF